MDFYEYIDRRIKEGLPGKNAQQLLMPHLGNIKLSAFKQKQNVRESAVLILLSKSTDHSYKVLYTLRKQALSHHGGQISFPGGHLEPNEDFYTAALREAAEETNLNSDSVNVIGFLTELYIPPSNSLVHPLLAYTSEEPQLTASDDEVEEIFWIDIKELLKKENFKEETWSFEGLAAVVPFWSVHHSTPLWGATAMITAELLQLYSEWISIIKL